MGGRSAREQFSDLGWLGQIRQIGKWWKRPDLGETGVKLLVAKPGSYGARRMPTLL